jgi:hypothetical protein
LLALAPAQQLGTKLVLLGLGLALVLVLALALALVFAQAIARQWACSLERA